MDEYMELLILAYFRNYKESYSLTELKDNLGISFGQLDSYLDCLQTERKLMFCEHMLQITEKGMIQLLTSEMSGYSFQINGSDFENEIDVIYKVHKFSRKKWRGNKI